MPSVCQNFVGRGNSAAHCEWVGGWEEGKNLSWRFSALGAAEIIRVNELGKLRSASGAILSLFL